MPFLGVQPTDTFASVAKQTITGDGSVTYTLTHSVASANDLAVFVNNVRQEPTVAYSASGTSITFTEAIASTDDCYVVYIARTFQTVTAPDNSINADQLSYPLTNFSSTGIDDNATSTAITINSSQNVSLSNDLTVDTDTLVVDSTNNAVGINTVTASGPQSTFHIEQNGDDADGGFRLSRDNALASYTQYIDSGSVWNLAYGNPSSDDSPTDILSVTSFGSVGIGTTGPQNQVHIKGDPKIRLEDESPAATAILDAGNGNILLRADVGQNQANSYVGVLTDGDVSRLRIDADGVKFGSDTAAANALDDYEEGTWTPTYYTNASGGSDSSVTYSGQFGAYTKIGRVVYVTCYLHIGTVTSVGTGNPRIGGLPFAKTSGESRIQFESYLHSWGTAYDNAVGYQGANEAFLRVLLTRNGGTWTQASTTGGNGFTMTTGGVLSFTGMYFSD